MADTPKHDSEILPIMEAAIKYKMPWKHVYNIAKLNGALLSIGYKERINMNKMPSVETMEIMLGKLHGKNIRVIGGEETVQTTIRITKELHTNIKIHSELANTDMCDFIQLCLNTGLETIINKNCGFAYLKVPSPECNDYFIVKTLCEADTQIQDFQHERLTNPYISTLNEFFKDLKKAEEIENSSAQIEYKSKGDKKK